MEHFFWLVITANQKLNRHQQLPPPMMIARNFTEKEVVKEVPVIKEVRILNGAKGSEKTVQELLDQELQNCRWKWKELKMDGDFTSAKMKQLGKYGWKMTHIMEWRIIKPEWKDKPDTMYFQKPLPRK